MRKTKDGMEHSKREVMVHKFHLFFSYEITPHFNFCPKNDGVVVIFSFLLLRPSKTSEALKKGPNFGFLTLNNA